ncbi:hypothetical protein JHK84_048888 [Glycine max]|nr:hypothetical protein JHK84_048888 [Glycine max]
MSPSKKIEPEEVEGEMISTSDYFFVKVGEALPLKSSDSVFDAETLPSQPLALSERFRLTFVAHSSGFFVAKTKDLIDSAKELKDKGSGSPVEQLSLVDVPVGRVRALALSTDNSTLAASVSGDIRFYSVESFLNKEVKQSFSCSLNDSTFVKDMRWITTPKHCYVVLSNIGKLYYGDIGFPLKHVMDNVDAENGDDNLLLGLCIDNVSIYQKVGVQIDVEERTELLPHCVLICLTLEGKLVMFHVASLAGCKTSPEVDSVLHNDEDTSVNLPEDEGCTLPQRLQKQESDKTFEVSGNLTAKPSGNPQQITRTDTNYPEVELVGNSESLKSNVQQVVPDVDAFQNTGNQNPFLPGEQQKNLGQKTATLGTSIGPLMVNSHSVSSGLSSYNNLQSTTKTRELWTANSSRDSQRASLPSETFSFPKKYDVSSISASSYADGVGFQNKKYTMGATNVPGSMGGKPVLVQDVNDVSPAIDSASRLVQSGGQLSTLGAGNMQPILNSSSHFSSDGNTAAIKSSARKFLPSNEQHGTPSKLGIFSSDLSKQFGNINEMTKELDLLLKSIEEAGGFRDACTRSLRSSIEAVEQGMDALSKKCKILTDLTYQLIELERHFNALELNKFSQYGGRCLGHGPSQNRYGPSRHTLSLHSLHNSVSSQLVAAENLSECLSKQMEALSLKSQTEERKNVKELFETIGIPYEAAFGSPDMKGFMKTPPSKKTLFSDLTANKDQSRRNQASAMKSFEPETARRRRDSLDQLEEVSEHSKAFMPADSLRAPTHVSESKSSVLQKNNILTIPSQPAFRLSPTMVRGHSTETKDLAAEKSTVQKFDLISNSENKPTLLWKMPQNPSIPTYSTTETPSMKIKSSEMPFPNSKMTMATSSTTGDKLSSSFTPESWGKGFPSSGSHLSTISAPSTFLGKVTEFHVDKSLPKENISAVPTFGGSFKSLSFPTIKTSPSPSSSSVSSAAVSVASSSLTSSNTSTDSNRVMSSSSTSASLHLSNQAPKDTVPSIPNPPGLKLTLESLKSEIPPAAALKSDMQPAAVSNSKTVLDASAEVVTRPNEPLNGASELKLGPSRNFSPTIEQPSNNTTSFGLNVVSVSQAAQPSDAPLQLSTSFLSSASVSNRKNEGLDFGISHEDEMEEEAPETSNNTTELSLGSFGGFGISSSPNPSMPKTNPFGGSFNNVATSLPSSTVTFSVPSGELFKPASFNFSSPQSSSPTQTTISGAFSGGFNAVAAVPAQAPGGFGQPAQIGSGQQVLGSVLGGFGQSRQLGSGFAAPSGFGGGFAGGSSPSGFSNTAIGGGFAGIASTGRGFGSVASTSSGGFSGIASGGGFGGGAAPGGGFGAAAPGGGFGAAATPGGGFAGAAAPGGGFGAASSTGGFAGAGSGGGFGAFSSQGSGGFGAFGSGGGSKPPELFTQMRK